MTLKICVYAISKNEENFVQRFYEASAEADLVLIADTGSTDCTVDKIESWQKISSTPIALHRIHVSPWRFDIARNAALALVPADMDVCVSLDLDEVLQPGWRQEIERVWEAGKTTRLRYYFDWGLGIKFKYEKIHARHGYKWHHPCHEYPTPYGIEEVWANTDMLLVIHKPDPTKSRGQYLPLLKMSIEEDPFCPRNAFYYARELRYNNMLDEAITQCDRYLALPRANWANERCYAYRVKGQCYAKKGDVLRAELALHMAASEAPGTREPWCELAELMLAHQRWAEAYAFATRCLSIEQHELIYTMDPSVWGGKPYHYAALGAWYLGLKDEAFRLGSKAVELEPNDEQMRKNLEFYSGKPSAEVAPVAPKSMPRAIVDEIEEAA